MVNTLTAIKPSINNCFYKGKVEKNANIFLNNGRKYGHQQGGDITKVTLSMKVVNASQEKSNIPIMGNYWYFLGIWLVHHWNFKMLYQYWYIEITAWLASAYDFYARVVKD